MSGIVLLVLRLILVALLYAFLAWVVYTIWMDIRSRTKTIVSHLEPPITLIQGAENRRQHFNQVVLTLGRDPACDIRMDDVTVSARHAKLVYRQGQWWVEDLNSTNGTFLNNGVVHLPTVLTTGDEIHCGKMAVIVDLGK